MGKYFTDKRAVQSSPASYDTDAVVRLWAESEQQTALAQHVAA